MNKLEEIKKHLAAELSTIPGPVRLSLPQREMEWLIARVEELEKSKNGENEAHDILLKDLQLSRRAHYCFETANLKTVGDLCRLNSYGVLKLKGVGRRTFREINQKLAELGLSLRPRI